MPYPVLPGKPIRNAPSAILARSAMQLTPYGIKFKIGGYTETNVKDAPLIPLSGMALAGFHQYQTR